MMPTAGTLAHLPAQLETVSIGQHQIEQHDVGRLGFKQVQGTRSIGRDASVKAPNGEIAADQIDDIGVVFYQ